MEDQRHKLSLFADYFQFYVCDEERLTDTGIIWDPMATDRMLASGPDLVAVCTARNMDVPVTLEILRTEPSVDFEDWDQVIECPIAFTTGKLVALGCTDSMEEAQRFPTQLGQHVVRVSYAGFNELSDDGLEGNDTYRVQIWPGSVDGIKVIKRRQD